MAKTGENMAISKKLLFGIYLGVLLVISAILSSAFSTSEDPVNESVKLPVQQFAQALAMWELAHRSPGGAAKMEIHVPAMEIYDPQGRLVFHGEDVAKNAELLHKLPAGLTELSPISPPENIKKVFTVVTELGKRADAIAANKKYTLFVTTSAANCNTCKPQDDAVAQLRSKKNADMNILQVALEK